MAGKTCSIPKVDDGPSAMFLCHFDGEVSSVVKWKQLLLTCVSYSIGHLMTPKEREHE